MLSVQDHNVLNELMVLHGRSLAAYLEYAAPWCDESGSGPGGEVISEIAASHQDFTDEIGEMILSANEVVFTGEFPMPYTGYHDLSIDFMLQKMVASETATIKRMLGCVEKAESDRVRAVAERSLGASQAHLQELEEFIASAT